MSEGLNWGIVIPHTFSKQGARDPIERWTEYEYAKEMVTWLNFPNSDRNDGGVKGAVDSLILKGCNATIEPHLNAFNGKSKGFEILVLKGDIDSYKCALFLARKFRETYPTRKLRNKNGIVEVSGSERGAKNLKIAKSKGMKVALLSEAFFIDNEEEWIKPAEMALFWSKWLEASAYEF